MDSLETKANSYSDNFNYEIIKQIGEGSFGKVYLAYCRQRRSLVILKSVQRVSKTYSNELDILTKIKNKSKYTINLIDFFISEPKKDIIVQNFIFKVFPLNLDQLINIVKKRDQHFKISYIKTIFKQILIALKDCHKMHIVHRDLKMNNILIDYNGDIKLTDFGKAKIITNKKKSLCHIVDESYRAPELCVGYSYYNEKIDIYAAAFLLVELFTFRPLYDFVKDHKFNDKPKHDIFVYYCILGNPPKSFFNIIRHKLRKEVIDYFTSIHLSSKSYVNIEKFINMYNYYDNKDVENAANLFRSMTNWNHWRRITAESALEHPFFNDTI